MLAATEAERAVLATIIVMPHLFQRIAKLLTADSFWKDEHRELWLAVEKAIADGDLPDIHGIRAALGGSFAAVGGVAYLAGILDDFPLKTEIADFVWTVKQAVARRRLYYAARRIEELSKDPGELEDIGRMARDEMLAALGDVKACVRRQRGTVDARRE